MASGNGHAVAVEVDGVRYASARAADLALGFTQNTTSRRAHSPDYPNYRWLGSTPGPKKAVSFEGMQIAKPFIEPVRWPNDEGRRRAPVLDPNFEPPRVVRQIGWRTCMCCGRWHFSDDVLRIRMCADCGGLGSNPIGSSGELDA